MITRVPGLPSRTAAVCASGVDQHWSLTVATLGRLPRTDRRLCVEARSRGLLLLGKQMIRYGAPLLVAVIPAGECGEGVEDWPSEGHRCGSLVMPGRLVQVLPHTRHYIVLFADVAAVYFLLCADVPELAEADTLRRGTRRGARDGPRCNRARARSDARAAGRSRRLGARWLRPSRSPREEARARAPSHGARPPLGSLGEASMRFAEPGAGPADGRI